MVKVQDIRPNLKAFNFEGSFDLSLIFGGLPEGFTGLNWIIGFG